MFSEPIDFTAFVPTVGFNLVWQKRGALQRRQEDETFHRGQDVFDKYGGYLRSEYGYNIFAANNGSNLPTWRTMQPDQEKNCQNLYREFSCIDINNTDQIIRFANRYGHITRAYSLNPAYTTDLNGNWVRVPYRGEALEIWACEIRRLRLAIELCEVARRGNLEEICGLIEFGKVEGKDSHSWVFPSEEITIIDPTATNQPSHGSGLFTYHPIRHHWDECPHGSNTDPRIVLQSFIDFQINAALFPEGTVRFATPSGSGTPGLFYKPSGLYNMMWFQLVRSLAQNTGYRNCKECGKPFVVLPEQRGHKEFCDHKCKLKAYRKRKKKEG